MAPALRDGRLARSAGRDVARRRRRMSPSVSRHARTHLSSVCSTIDGETEIARLALPGRRTTCISRLRCRLAAGARYGLRADGPLRPDARPPVRSGEAAGRSLCEAARPGLRLSPRAAAPPAAALDTAPCVPKAIVTAGRLPPRGSARAGRPASSTNSRSGPSPSAIPAFRRRCAAPSRRSAIRRSSTI